MFTEEALRRALLERLATDLAVVELSRREWSPHGRPEDMPCCWVTVPDESGGRWMWAIDFCRPDLTSEGAHQHPTVNCGHLHHLGDIFLG